MYSKRALAAIALQFSLTGCGISVPPEKAAQRA